MKLSISNIGWSANQDDTTYNLMKKYGYSGLEIAPTRIITQNPYDNIQEMQHWYYNLSSRYKFSISSMQSIWYGRTEKLFGSREERDILLNYTKKAIDFAASVNCKNLVFGCPKNRWLPDGTDESHAITFFRELGDYASSKGTVLGLEANPPIYHTNYINDTKSAIDLINKVDSRGFMLNLDVGTMIYNNEEVSELTNYIHLINHVHISEPNLLPIRQRTLHYELSKILIESMYSGYISIEAGKRDDISLIEGTLQYIKGVFS